MESEPLKLVPWQERLEVKWNLDFHKKSVPMQRVSCQSISKNEEKGQPYHETVFLSPSFFHLCASTHGTAHTFCLQGNGEFNKDNVVKCLWVSQRSRTVIILGFLFLSRQWVMAVVVAYGDVGHKLSFRQLYSITLCMEICNIGVML